MKHIVQLSLFALLCVSCVKNTDETPGKDAAGIDAIESLADFAVPVRAGQTSIVTLGADTLAVTAEAATISVPRYAALAGDIRVTYTDADIYDNFASFTYWQYVSFEDSRKADYDYNDLVIHGRIFSEQNKSKEGGKFIHKVAVQPVALGGSVRISLGILYKKDKKSPEISEVILAADVRATLFNGNPLFPINTDPGKEVKKVSEVLTTLFTTTTDDPQFPVVWFIEAGGQRFYAATTNFGSDKNCEMLSEDGLPYGISLTQKWDYPQEKVHIWDAYPNFNNWVKKGNEQKLLKDRNQQLVFKACKPTGGPYDDLWDWTY
ncbi:MAG: LruC domain-containing protein [Rikenellaceae bacterium]|nr:LruC domain-containing protein [Rikenellaceae bacterium]